MSAGFFGLLMLVISSHIVDFQSRNVYIVSMKKFITLTSLLVCASTAMLGCDDSSSSGDPLGSVAKPIPTNPTPEPTTTTIGLSAPAEVPDGAVPAKPKKKN